MDGLILLATFISCLVVAAILGWIARGALGMENDKYVVRQHIPTDEMQVIPSSKHWTLRENNTDETALVPSVGHAIIAQQRYRAYRSEQPTTLTPVVKGKK